MQSAAPAPARSVYAVAAGAFSLLIVASLVRPYGWFIDELYYLACARRLAFGYVDHPPLSIGVLAAVHAVAGSRLAARSVAAAALAGTVVLAARIARELGGGRRAQVLAAAAVASAPGLLTLSSFYSMNAFEVLAWTAMSLLAARVLVRGEPRGWVGLGLVAGLALENKHTSATFLAALVVALLLTRERKHLATRWAALGAALACALVLPNLVWQTAHGWPSLAFYRAAQSLKNVPTSPFAAAVAQAVMMGPVAFALALVGAASTARASDGRRALGLLFALLFALMIASGSSRPDRIAGAYPAAIAAGAVAVERVAATRRWLVPLAFGALAITCAPLWPVALPLLPPARAAAYAATLRVVPRPEKKTSGALPQWLADRLGWEAFARQVEGVVASLPADERARAAVLVPDYGHAGALELYGAARVLSPQNSYWAWSAPLAGDTQVVVAVDVSRATLARLFEDVRDAGVFHCDGCMPSRNDLPIAIARRPRVPLGDAWAGMAHFE